jgi:hypothetical protein
MNANLENLAARLGRATTVEEIFGEISGEDGLQQAYHRLARQAHPDAYTSAEDRTLAQRVFPYLVEWLERAREKMFAGAYGTGVERYPIPLRTRKRAYAVNGAYTEEDVYLRYPCRYIENEKAILAELRIVRDPRDNPLAMNEARSLHLLRPEGKEDKFAPYFPRLVDDFLLVDDGVERQGNICRRQLGWYTLAEVRAEYCSGIDPKDMAWIWRRLLVALGAAHAKGIVHGAVLPENVLILPAEHGLLLNNWAFSALIEGNGAIPGINAAYTTWYSEEVLNGGIFSPGADIFLAARCMIYLLGGDPTLNLPYPAPKVIQSFLKGCTLASPRARPQDAWALKEEFDDMLQQLWGKRAFHPFIMNSKPKYP